MRKSILTFLILFSVRAVYCQTAEKFSKLNSNFEIVENKKPVGWKNFGNGNYKLSIDSLNFKSGRYSAAIEYKDGDIGFQAWSFTLTDNYPGKKITLTGYIKTENVTDGYAGLWMRIDP